MSLFQFFFSIFHLKQNYNIFNLKTKILNKYKLKFGVLRLQELLTITSSLLNIDDSMEYFCNHIKK